MEWGLDDVTQGKRWDESKLSSKRLLALHWRLTRGQWDEISDEPWAWRTPANTDSTLHPPCFSSTSSFIISKYSSSFLWFCYSAISLSVTCVDQCFWPQRSRDYRPSASSGGTVGGREIRQRQVQASSCIYRLTNTNDADTHVMSPGNNVLYKTSSCNKLSLCCCPRQTPVAALSSVRLFLFGVMYLGGCSLPHPLSFSDDPFGDRKNNISPVDEFLRLVPP